MKLKTPRPSRHHAKPKRGSVLVAVMVVSAILSIAAGGYLTYLNHEYYLNYRSLHWTQALHLCESGIEDGIQEINFKYLKGAGFASGDGWQPIGGAVAPLISFGGGDTGFSKTVTGFTDTSGAVVGDYTIQVINPSSENPVFVAKATVTNHPYGKPVSRMAKVIGYERALFSYAVFSDGQIDGVNADSYDSSNPLYSTDGQYDPDKKRDRGDVGTNSTVTDTIDVGIAIYGTASVGPGGTVSGGIVGPFGTPNNTVATGYFRDDTRVDIPPPSLPSNFSPSVSYGNLNSGTVSSGDYTATSLGGGVVFEGNVRIHVKGNIGVSGNKEIKVTPGSKVEIYVDGDMDIGGNGFVNPGNPTTLQLYGMATSKSINLHGNGAFSGAIYAPTADLTLKGGGNSGVIYGSVVVKSYNANGGAAGKVWVHYDEALKQSGPSVGYRATSWQELPVAQP